VSERPYMPAVNSASMAKLVCSSRAMCCVSHCISSCVMVHIAAAIGRMSRLMPAHSGQPSATGLPGCAAGDVGRGTGFVVLAQTLLHCSMQIHDACLPSLHAGQRRGEAAGDDRATALRRALTVVLCLSLPAGQRRGEAAGDIRAAGGAVHGGGRLQLPGRCG